jgi:hypothetical protein
MTRVELMVVLEKTSGVHVLRENGGTVDLPVEEVYQPVYQ